MFKIILQRRENTRGLITRTVELGDTPTIESIVGVIEAALRQMFPRDMRRKNLNLSRIVEVQIAPEIAVASSPNDSHTYNNVLSPSSIERQHALYDTFSTNGIPSIDMSFNTAINQLNICLDTTIGRNISQQPVPIQTYIPYDRRTDL